MEYQIIEELIGKVATKVHVLEDEGEDVLEFVLEDGTRVAFLHYQDCCESVYIKDIVGNLSDLENAVIVEAEEAWQSGDNAVVDDEDDDEYGYCGDSSTWTFYKFGTNKGSVTVSWFGTSNGYYSEGVSISVLQPGEESHYRW